MYLQANTMTCTMNKVLDQTYLSQNITSQGISFTARYTSMQLLLARSHCIQHSSIDLTHTCFCGFPQADGARHIRAIAPVASPHINGDKFTTLNAALTSNGVRHRAVWT